MTTENLTPAETAAKRADQINAIRDFAVWLDRNPAVLVPSLTLTRHLQNGYDGTEPENLATVRGAAASLAVGTDEGLDDRTVLRVKVNEHVWYELFAWHKAGRDHGTELERLRAENAILRGAAAIGIDPSGLLHSREPESTVVAPVPAGVEGHPEGRAAGIPAHYDTTADPSSSTTDCACGAVFRSATAPEAVAVLKAHIAAPELKPETVALVARVEAALPSQNTPEFTRIQSQNTPEFTRIQERLLSTQVCTSLPDDEATVRMNLLPSGTSHGWQLSTEPENAPVPCADQPETHRHLIFDC